MMSSGSSRMSHCVVPNWKLRHQRQEQAQGEEGNRSSHVQINPHSANNTTTIPIPDYRQVKELTWENGHIAMHGIGGLLPSGPAKPTWARTGGTLESIVHQATCHTQDPNVAWTPAIIDSNIAGFPGGKWAENNGGAAPPAATTKKRSRADSDHGGPKNFSSMQEDHAGPSACASASATFCRDSDTTMVTWASFDSPNNLKSKTTDHEDSASHGGLENQDEDQETKDESGRSNPARRSRAAAVHNQSERRRRDRINQKMKALQKLVPNASKTDKASMLDEVIDYLKQLQAQVQLMNTVRNMQPPAPHPMVMPLGMHQQQQHLQMSLLAAAAARMGMGMGMGMLDLNSVARATTHSLPQLVHPNPLAAAAAASAGPTFVAPQFLVPPHMVPAQGKPVGAGGASSAASSVPLPDPYCALLAQVCSMNMELYNKMAALYSQQVSQTTQAMSSPSRSSHTQAD